VILEDLRWRAEVDMNKKPIVLKLGLRTGEEEMIGGDCVGMTPKENDGDEESKIDSNVFTYFYP